MTYKKIPHCPSAVFSAGLTHSDPRSLAETAFEHIKASILSGSLAAGEKIAEEVIARDLEMSRTPIREALRHLEQYGLVVIKPRSCVIVAGISDRQASEIAHTRLELERLVAKYLFLNAGAEDKAALRKLARKALDKAERRQMPEALSLDGAFHLEMARRCGNETLYGILERLDGKMQLLRMRIASRITEEKCIGAIAHHMVILDMLECGSEAGLLRAVFDHLAPELRWAFPARSF